ncbi:MAG: efflux RND transporter periplasmic adaptor subunit [Pirellulales bacterium]|nr:efflux RND transporter periplasmic adaptor subunit [Pirellulales bacterium]
MIRSNLSAVVVVLVAGAGVLLTAGVGQYGEAIFGKAKEQPKAEARAVPRAPVVVMDAALEKIELIDAYHGMVRPFERFVLAFEVAGRLEALGENADGKPLDEGDAVQVGQMLAQLDRRIFNARLKEAKTRLEQAQYDIRRAENIRKANPEVISDTEYQDWVTKLQLAEAQFDMTEKNVLDATLLAPATGVLSKRMINPGELVNMHQTVFEIIQVDRVLLVLGVPESRIAPVRVGQKVHVSILARDRFGEDWPEMQGQVYRVAEAADDRSGLFEVEVLLDNPQGRIRPGHVAEGRIVIDEVEGYRLPVDAAVVRDGQTIIFSVDDAGHAQAYEIGAAREQDGSLIVRELPEAHRHVVVRGQHRLVAGREVEQMRGDDLLAEEGAAAMAAPAPVPNSEAAPAAAGEAAPAPAAHGAAESQAPAPPSATLPEQSVQR